MSANVPLLERTLDAIEVTETFRRRGIHIPHGWDNEYWANLHPDIPHCNASFCFAGWALLLSDAKFDFEDDGLAAKAELDDTTDYVEDLAQELLGLTDDQSDALFSTQHRTVESLRRTVEDIKAGRL